MNATRFSKSRAATLTLVLFNFVLLASPVTPCFAGNNPAPPDSAQPVYVGHLVCKPCHEKEYDSFIAHTKKSKSYQSIERLKKGLSEEDLKKCYSCHTTGYGQPGGFISVEETPHLKNAGCEVCHGPGSIHIEREDSESINGLPTIQICDRCHTGERIKAFRFKPLIRGGGH